MPGGRIGRLRHLQALYPPRDFDRRALRFGRERRHRHLRQRPLAGGLHRPALAVAHRGGPGQQHRPAVGPLARQGDRSVAQVGTARLPAVVQLRAAGEHQQFRQRPRRQNLQPPHHRQLAVRHLQRAHQYQAQVQGALPPKYRVPPGRAHAVDRQRRQPLLYVADARQPAAGHPRNGRPLEKERRDHAFHEGGRHDHRGRGRSVRG